MSWLDQVNNDFILITGDAEEYKPNWMNASRSVEYNVSQYEFPEVSGTLVRRRKPKGTKYNLEIFFQGDDHLELSEAFRVSAEDSRAWTIIHPFYGAIIVQPLNLNFDNTNFNVSEIKGTIVETITDNSPKITVDPTDKIVQDKATVDEIMAASFEELPEYPVELEVEMTDKVSNLYDLGKIAIELNEDAEAYFNLFNNANTAILDLTNEPLAAIRAVQSLATYPSQFVTSVQNRIDTLVSQFNKFTETIEALTSPQLKTNYEVTAGTVVTTLMLASISDAVYDSREDVFSVMEDILSIYDEYLVNLDSLQTTTGGDPDSYTANAGSIIAMDELVNFTVASLFEIALNSKQERSILCESDTNVIILAHRFYGLQLDDSTIDKIIANNKIGLLELFQIRKGRKIIYYV